MKTRSHENAKMRKRENAKRSVAKGESGEGGKGGEIDKSALERLKGYYSMRFTYQI